MSDGRFGVGGQGGYLGSGYGPLYLDSLVDTVIDNLTDGFVLTYEASSGKWKVKPISRTFTISATIKVPDVGYTIVWRAPFDCTCTKLEGRQKDGTSTVINARYNDTTDVATVDLTLTAAGQWYDTTGINQTAWSATDWMEIEVVTVGSATEITFVLTFTEP